MTRARSPSASDDIVGTSPEVERVRRAIAQIAPSRATVLLRGESGAGKQLIARAIHESSPRAAGPFVRLHCAGLPESRQEHELFGQNGEPGAPAGSRFEQANGGTLFLDEVEHMLPASQARLLSVLEEHELEHPGGSEPEKIDVRVIAATDKNLKDLVESGKFREDLFYRLNVVDIHLPSLRERRSDIPLLARHFLAKYAAENAKAVSAISDAALQALSAYGWPGNVRELEKAIEHAVVLSEGATIEPAHLPRELGSKSNLDEAPTVPGATIDELERYAILKTLEAVGGSTSKAAAKLGISVRKIQYKLQEYGSSGRGL